MPYNTTFTVPQSEQFQYKTAPVIAKEITTFPGSQQKQTIVQPIVSEVKSAEPTTKIGSAYPRAATRVAREASGTTTQTEEEKKKTGTSTAGLAGAATGIGVNQLIGSGGTSSVATPALVSASRIPEAAAASAPASSTIAGMSTEAGPVLVDTASGVPVATGTETGLSAAVQGPGLGSSVSAIGGTAAAAAGAYIAIHQAPKVMNAIKYGDTKGAIAHGVAAGAGAGAAVGGAVGSIVPGVGTLVGAGIGAAIGSVVGAIGGAVGASRTGKDKDQINRDLVRDILQDQKMLDDNYNITLGDGSKFDMGVDGHGKNFDGTGYAYQVARDNPFSVQAVGWASAFANVLCGEQRKLATDFTGYFANAAMSNAQDMEDVRLNILTFMDQAGVTRQMLEESLGNLKEAGSLSEQEYAANMASLDTLFSGKNYVTMSWAEAEKQFGGGTPTDQSPASVQTPSADVPDRQTGPAIYDIDPGRLPGDTYQKMAKLYGYYDANRQKRAEATSSPAATVAQDVAMEAANIRNPQPTQIPQPAPLTADNFPAPQRARGVAAQIAGSAPRAPAPLPPETSPSSPQGQQPLEIQGLPTQFKR